MTDSNKPLSPLHHVPASGSASGDGPLPPIPIAPTSPPPPQRDGSSKRRSGKRWIWRGLAGLVLLLVVLVVLAPMIASSGLVRGRVVKSVNQQLEGGRVEIASFGFGWLGGQRVEGIRVLDADDAAILDVNFSTGLSLFGAITGSLDVKETVLEVSANKIVVDLDTGLTNLPRMRETEKSTTPKATPKTGDDKLPDLRGNVLVKLSGTIETRRGGAAGPTVRIAPSELKLNIPTINEGISVDGVIAMMVDGKPASIRVGGKIDAIEGRVIQSDVAKVDADLKVAFEAFDLAIAEAILPLVGMNRAELGGVLGGDVVVKLKPGSAGSITSTLGINEFRMSLPELQGDRIVAKRMEMPIDVAFTPVGDDLDLTIRAMSIASEAFRVDVSGGFKTSALSDLAANRAPKSAGRIEIGSTVPELQRIALMLPATLGIREGVEVKSGSVGNRTTIDFVPNEGVKIAQTARIEAGGVLEGKALRLDPVETNFEAAIALDGSEIDGANALLRKLSRLTFGVRGAFADLKGEGNDRGVKLAGTFDLDRLQQQIGQFVELGGYDVAGAGSLDVSLSGDLGGGKGPIAYAARIDAERLGLTSGEQVMLLNETLRVRAGGSIAKPGDDVKLSIANLRVDTDSGLLNFGKEGEAAAEIVVRANGLVAGRGTFRVSGNLARLAQIAGVEGDPGTKLDSGVFDVTAQLASDDVKRMYEVKLDGTLSKIVVGTLMKDERAEVVGRFYMPDDFSKVSAWLDVFSGFGSIKIADVDAQLLDAAGKPVPPLGMVRRASLTGEIKSLPKLFALVDGLVGVNAQGIAPMKIESGTMSFGGSVWSDATEGTIGLSLDLPSVENVVMSRGSERFASDKPMTAEIDARLSVDPSKADVSLASVRRIDVQKLRADAWGVAQVKMLEMIQIENPAGEPKASGRVEIGADLQPLMRVLGIVSGEPVRPIAGVISMIQTLKTDAGSISLEGEGRGRRLRSLDAAASKLEPQELTLANRIRIDTKRETVQIDTLSLKSADGQTIAIDLKGRLSDFAKSKKLEDVQLDLAYSADRLWKLAQPLVDPKNELVVEEISGDFSDRVFKIAGNLADPRTLQGGGEIKLKRVAMSGLDLRGGGQGEAISIPIQIKDGVLRFATPDGSPVRDMAVNGGTLRLAGISVDLNDMTISAPRNHRLIADAQINAILTKQLGKFASALFAQNSKADGRLDVTLHRLSRLPLGDFSKMQEDQTAKIAFSIRGMELDGMVPKLLAQAADLGGSIRGEVRDASIEIAGGQSKTDLAVTLLRREGEADQRLPLRFSGGIDLNSFELRGYQISVPTKLIKWGDLQKFAGESFVVPVKGTASAPSFDLAGAVQRELRRNLINPGSILRSLTGRDDEKKDAKPEQGQTR